MASTPQLPPVTLDPPTFHRYLLENHAAFKARHPSLSRRALRLLIADEFWSLYYAPACVPHVRRPTSTTSHTVDAPWAHDGSGGDKGNDAADDDDNDDDDTALRPGIVLRADYSAGSDGSWTAFCGALRDAERDFLADQDDPGPASTPVLDADGDVEMASASSPSASAAENDADVEGSSSSSSSSDNAAADSEEEEEEGEEEEGKRKELVLVLFTLISDSTRFNDISNLRALRLLFDVSVRTAPSKAAPSHDDDTSTSTSTTVAIPASRRGREKVQQQQRQHRLTCQRGLQETYDTRGRTLWIFDVRSRSDGSARLVSEAGDVATGDSWRARVTHMVELQASLAARALHIDFGGLDRWDYAERQRNIREADAGYAAALSELK